MGVTVELRFYAHLRDAVGAKRLRREYPAGTTVGEVLEAVVEEFPALEPHVFDDDGTVSDTFVVRLGGEPADLGRTVEPGDSLAVMAQVVGG